MSVPVTEKNLLDLKQNLTKTRDVMLTAEATYAELLKTLEAQKDDLAQFGIASIEEIDPFIEKLQSEIEEGYKKYTELYERVMIILT